MIFKIINKEGEVDLVFSWRERFILFFRGRIKFTAHGFRHFGNILVDIVFGYFKYCPENLKKFISPPTQGVVNPQSKENELSNQNLFDKK
jgi:hypothetical protein